MSYTERRADARIVDQSSGMLGENPQQPRHLSAMLDLRNVMYIALDDRFGVTEEGQLIVVIRRLKRVFGNKQKNKRSPDDGLDR